ncbi:MAG: hypothetical protein AB7D36_04485 [Oscillospiraceae bacterium]
MKFFSKSAAIGSAVTPVRCGDAVAIAQGIHTMITWARDRLLSDFDRIRLMFY